MIRHIRFRVFSNLDCIATNFWSCWKQSCIMYEQISVVANWKSELVCVIMEIINVSLEFLIDLSFFSKPLNDSVSGCSACEERWNVSDFNFQTERHDMLLVWCFSCLVFSWPVQYWRWIWWIMSNKKSVTLQCLHVYSVKGKKKNPLIKALKN